MEKVHKIQMQTSKQVVPALMSGRQQGNNSKEGREGNEAGEGNTGSQGSERNGRQ